MRTYSQFNELLILIVMGVGVLLMTATPVHEHTATRRTDRS